MRIYRLSARLAELQLELAERGRVTGRDLEVARDVLVGARQVLLAALGDADSGDPGQISY